MKLSRIIGVLVTVLAVLAPAHSIAKKADTLYYEVKMKSEQGDMGTRKMYMKGSRFAWEYDSAGLTVTVIKTEDGVTMIWPEKKRGWKYPKGSTRESPMSYLPGPAGDVKQFLAKNKAQKDGAEKIGKKDCLIYTYKEEVSKWKCKLWVEKKTLNPVKLVMMGAKPSDATTVTYVKYQRGAEVADSRFKVPKDITVHESKLHENSAPSKAKGK